MPLTYTLIVSRGRIADRTPGAIAGAEITARALGQYFSQEATFAGEPEPPRQDGWAEALEQADDTLRALRDAVSAALHKGEKPLLIANTCSASLASLPAVASACPDALVLWIDAHGDFNTPQTTQSGYLGGMVLAAACGLWESGHGQGLDPRQVIIPGARDIDPAESALLSQAGVRVLPPASVTAETIISIVGNRPVWIHVDWDVLEPGYIPAAYAIADGLLPQTLREIFGALPEDQILGVELAEFEASGDPAPDARALDIILDTVAPLLREH